MEDGEIVTYKIFSLNENVFSPQVFVINWSSLGNPYEINYLEMGDIQPINTNRGYNLTENQLAGLQNFNVELKLNEVPKEFLQYGRYSLQINLIQLKYLQTSKVTNLEKENVTPRINIYLD